MDIKENITVHLGKKDVEEIIKEFLTKMGYNTKKITFKLSDVGGDDRFGYSSGYKDFSGADCSVSKN